MSSADEADPRIRTVQLSQTVIDAKAQSAHGLVTSNWSSRSTD